MSLWTNALSRANDLIHDSAGAGLLGISPDDVRTGAVSGLLPGTNGNDTIQGSDGRDVILAGRGDDTVHAGAGNDLGLGGSGRDYIRGGTGNDVLYGGSERDFLQGDSGDDLLVGGYGDDRLYASDSGDDTLVGGPGHDYFMVGGSVTPGDTITALDFQLGEDSLYATDLYGVTDVRSLNGGCDTELVFTDVRHADNPAPGVSLVLSGVSISDIENYLHQPIDGGAGLGPLFAANTEVFGW